MTTASTKRIQDELRAAGVTSYGLKKFNSRYVPKIIHDDERVMAVVYGRFRESSGFLNWVDRMLIATDQRVISLNHKPGFTDVDELMYDMVAGVEMTTAGPFTAVTLYTRVHNITVRFVNARCAERFVHFVEQRRINQPYRQ